MHFFLKTSNLTKYHVWIGMRVGQNTLYQESQRWKVTSCQSWSCWLVSVLAKYEHVYLGTGRQIFPAKSVQGLGGLKMSLMFSHLNIGFFPPKRKVNECPVFRYSTKLDFEGVNTGDSAIQIIHPRLDLVSFSKHHMFSSNSFGHELVRPQIAIF